MRTKEILLNLIKFSKKTLIKIYKINIILLIITICINKSVFINNVFLVIKGYRISGDLNPFGMKRLAGFISQNINISKQVQSFKWSYKVIPNLFYLNDTSYFKVKEAFVESRYGYKDYDDLRFKQSKNIRQFIFYFETNNITEFTIDTELYNYKTRAIKMKNKINPKHGCPWIFDNDVSNSKLKTFVILKEFDLYSIKDSTIRNFFLKDTIIYNLFFLKPLNKNLQIKLIKIK